MITQHTAVILLGGSQFPYLESVEPSSALRKSSTEFKKYIEENLQALQCAPDLILDLFDSDESGSIQLEHIHQFLNAFIKSTAITDGFNIRNLIIYYAGHGLILGEDGEFGLAVNYTKSDRLVPTSITMGQFAGTIKTPARFMRKFIILDCCFAAKMISIMLPGDSASSLAQIVQRKTTNEFKGEGKPHSKEVPTRGMAVLCAADKDSVAIGSHPAGTTLFTGALLEALARHSAQNHYSLQELNDLTWHCILESDHHVRPVVFSPDQREGDIARLPIFPRRMKQSSADACGETRAGGASAHQDDDVIIEPIEPVQPAEEPSEGTSTPPQTTTKDSENSNEKYDKTRTPRDRLIVISVISSLLIMLGSVSTWFVVREDAPMEKVLTKEVNSRDPVKESQETTIITPSDLNFGNITSQRGSPFPAKMIVDYAGYDLPSNTLQFNYQSKADGFFSEDFRALVKVDLGKTEVTSTISRITLTCKNHNKCITLLNISGKCPSNPVGNDDNSCADIRDEIIINVPERTLRITRFEKALIYYSHKNIVTPTESGPEPKTPPAPLVYPTVAPANDSNIVSETATSAQPNNSHDAAPPLKKEQSLEDLLAAIKASSNKEEKSSLRVNARNRLIESMKFGTIYFFEVDQSVKTTSSYSFVSYSPDKNIIKIQYKLKTENNANGPYITLEDIEAVVSIKINRVDRLFINKSGIAFDCNFTHNCIAYDMIRGDCYFDSTLGEKGCGRESYNFVVKSNKPNPKLTRFSEAARTLVYKIDGRPAD